MLLRNLHARHCLADGSNELQCPQRKNVGTAVSCSPVIRIQNVRILYIYVYTLVVLLVQGGTSRTRRD
jgi:hypothetical protein